MQYATTVDRPVQVAILLLELPPTSAYRRHAGAICLHDPPPHWTGPVPNSSFSWRRHLLSFFFFFFFFFFFLQAAIPTFPRFVHV
jgi:hypothetical protein